MQSKDVYWEQNLHLNSKGYDMIAKLMSEYILENRQYIQDVLHIN